MNVVAVTNNLGLLYEDREDYRGAEPMYRRAVAIMEQALGPEHPRLRDPLGNLANVYAKLGQYDEAERLYERVLKLVEKSLGPKHAATGMWLSNFAEALRYKSDFARAEALYRRSIEVTEGAMGPEHISLAGTLNGLSILQEARGEVRDALAIQRRVIDMSEREVLLNLATGSERQRLAFFKLLEEPTSQIVSTSLQSASGNPEAIGLAATVILQRKGLVQDAMARTLSSLRSKFQPEDWSLLSQWNETSSQLASLVVGGPQRKPPLEYQKAIKDLENRRESLEEALGRRTRPSWTTPTW